MLENCIIYLFCCISIYEKAFRTQSDTVMNDMRRTRRRSMKRETFQSSKTKNEYYNEKRFIYRRRANLLLLTIFSSNICTKNLS